MEVLAVLSDWFVTADIPVTKDNVKPGWVALGIVAALGVALFFLLRSMVKHTKRAAEPWAGDEVESQDSEPTNHSS